MVKQYLIRVPLTKSKVTSIDQVALMFMKDRSPSSNFYENYQFKQTTVEAMEQLFLTPQSQEIDLYFNPEPIKDSNYLEVMKLRRIQIFQREEKGGNFDCEFSFECSCPDFIDLG